MLSWVYRFNKTSSAVCAFRPIIYGEYFISTEITVGKGITKLNDTIEAQNILPLYDGYDLKDEW